MKDSGETYPGRPVPTASPVTDAQCVEGAARRAIDTQVGSNGSPKARLTNCWGIGDSDTGKS